ncbi:MAG TPA: tripartite tricarboxylate transporter substrate binding protein [Xanthobacteraceae bacterium]
MPLSVSPLVRPAIVAAALALAAPAQAAWPERPVTIIVPFTAGGITDLLARALAERLQAALKEPFLVEDLPGGAGVVAADHVLRAQPDGYTLLFTPIFQITMAPFTHAVKFDPVRDFKPIAAVASSPFVITVGTSVPPGDLAAFIAYVKAQPGKLTYGTAGSGSLTHVSSAVFLKSAGLDMIQVPYKGLGQAFTDLLGGQIAMMSASPVEVKPYLDSGKIRPLAVTGATRSKQLPGVPAIAETIKSPPVITINGLVAAAQVPQEVIDTLSRAIVAAEKSPDFVARIDKLGAEPMVTTPAEFAKIIADDTALWRDAVRDLGLKAQ